MTSINIYGAYTRLRDNSKSAMVAAIELYNKPNFEYRDECCVILLINAWELIIKALLSKNRIRIYYPKKRNEDYRTFSLSDSLRKAQAVFPNDLEYVGVKSNLDQLIDFRHNAIHFYNVEILSSIIYNLAQACIKNYCDLLRYSFGIDMADEVNIFLMPLSVGRMPIDPLQFISGEQTAHSYPAEVGKYLVRLGDAIAQLETANIDVSRLMITFSLKFESVKKARDSDAIVAVDSNATDKVASRRFDPNNFIREKDILNSLPVEIDGTKVNQHTFRGFVLRHDIRRKPHLYWRDDDGVLTKYSPEVAAMIRNASGSELSRCREEYSAHIRRKS